MFEPIAAGCQGDACIPFTYLFFFQSHSQVRLCLSCWTMSRVTQAWKTAIVIQPSQGVIVGIRWLPYQHHMKHLWLAGSDGLAGILIFRTELVRSNCLMFCWHEQKNHQHWNLQTATCGPNDFFFSFFCYNTWKKTVCSKARPFIQPGNELCSAARLIRSSDAHMNNMYSRSS